jgi:hypothetical protein
LVVTDDNVSITGFTQNHLLGKSNENVEVLYATDQTIFYLPKNIQNFFPNLRGITIFKSKLKVWRREDISPFPNLLFFYLYTNDIPSIDGDLLEKNPGVQYISFTANPIKHFGPNLIKPLNKLIEFHCTQCTCVSAYWNTNGLDQMQSEFASKCPPTFEMIEKTILNGKQFKAKVEEQVIERTRELMNSLIECALTKKQKMEKIY